MSHWTLFFEQCAASLPTAFALNFKTAYHLVHWQQDQTELFTTYNLSTNMTTTFYLSPTGNDLLDGLSSTKAAQGQGPWATLSGARDALRKLRADGMLHGHATVVVNDGIYPMTETVQFSPPDSHTSFVAAPGANPVFDGSRALSGWQETLHGERRAWTLDLPEVVSGHLYFRSLFAAGERRPRARYPKFSPDVIGGENTFRIGEMRFPDKRDLFAGDHVFKPAEGDMQNWPSLHDAEIVLLHYWVETRLPNPRLDPATGWVSCTRRSVFNLYESFNPKLARYYIDNLFEALTEPGEWYLDRATGRLTYLPMPDETLENTCVVVPVVNQFIEVAGDAYNYNDVIGDPFGTQFVENLRFAGLTFRYSDWYRPSAEMLSHNMKASADITDVPLGSAPQSAAHVPAVVRFRWARGCAFEGNTVEHTGFTAVEVGAGCRDFEIRQNTLQKLGGGGVKIGGSELDGPAGDRTGYIRFTDNIVRNVGRVFHQSCGVLLTHAFNCDLIHNEIAHTCYTGISCGWSWGYRETITRNIRIENNHIHDIGEGVLSDNGGIYLLGVQPGTVVRGNHIYRVTAADYGAGGIYPDEGCSHVLIEHNWVHDNQGGCLGIHFSRELVVRFNVFMSNEGAFAGVGRVENHIHATLTKNLFIGSATGLYAGAYRGDIRTAFICEANILAFEPSEVPPSTHPEFREDVPHSISFADWKKAGNDRSSLVTPIKYRQTETNFTLPEDSPALEAGFRLFDWSICGPRVS